MATECTACNGFYGPVNSSSPMCDRCHSFLYPATLMECFHPLGLLLTVTGEDGTRGIISLRPGERKMFTVRIQKQNVSLIDSAAERAEWEYVASRSKGIILEQCLVDGENEELQLKLSGKSSTGIKKLRLQYSQSTSVEVEAVCTSEAGCSHPFKFIVAFYHEMRSELEPNDNNGEVRNQLSRVELNLIIQVKADETEGDAKDITNVPVLNLPVEMSLVIFRQLDVFSLASVAQTCTNWCNIVHNHFPEAGEQLLSKTFPVVQLPQLSGHNTSNNDTTNMDKYFALLHSSPCLKCVYRIHYENHADWPKWVLENGRIKWESIDKAVVPGVEYQLVPVNKSKGLFQGSFQGPLDSPYEGGQFLLSVKLQVSYPFTPPMVKFLTKIYHPNISKHGDIGVNILQDNWSPAYDMKHTLMSICDLLTDPNTKICMEPEIGRQYEAEREEFDKTARLWTQKFAMS